MGFLKKIFKPVAKVLDKIVPNEIKPALPYLAAFAPIFAPAGMQGIIGSTMGRRALTSGLLNIGAQLSQEGSEGDINLLSAGLGALSGAMTTPGADFAGMTTKGSLDPALSGTQQAKILADRSFLTKAGDFGLEGLAKGSEFLRPGGEIPNLFSKEGLKIATAPAAQATGDVMQAQARQLEKQAAIDAALAEAEALADSGARAAAIRNAMNAYGFFTDEEIEDTIASAGYRAGGRVGLKGGGSDFGDREIKNLKAVEAMEGKFGFTLDDLKDKGFERDLDTVLVMIEGPDGVEIKEVLKSEALRDNLKIVSDTGEFPERRKAGGRVGFRFGGIDEAIESVQEETIKKGKEGIMTAAKEDPLLVEEYNKYVFDLMEQRPNAKPMSFQDFKRMIMSGMKDGGLMDLGGKEMDLRGGGFVPIGKKERADDVPARLSKNEFVMTADAVRAAGGGSVNEGAKRMYKVMNDLEARA